MKQKILMHIQSGRLYTLSPILDCTYVDPVCPSFDGQRIKYHYLETEFEGIPIGTMTENTNLDEFVLIGEL